MPSGNVDAQISAVERISEPQSVLDVVLAKAKGKNYDAANPFLLRVLFCGKKKSVGFGGVLEKIVREAKQECDSANPFYSEESAGQIGTLLIDYGEYFIQLVDGPENYVFRYSEKLSSLPFVESSNVQLLYLDDDIPNMLCTGATIIDKVPPSSIAPGSSDKSIDDIADLVIHDVNSMIELGAQESSQVARVKRVFTDNAKINFPKLFPRVELLIAYMHSGNFFTLDEFITNFCKPANLVREVEIAHPAEDPLTC
ncbi:hypothetical protein ABB37_05687 [Leptomonas pyrrhocoris]|uniref:Uncharacterized protein n=1 Tax=Leptomonas pyrrhocoris TaxID=157538 RepID=A0A0M9FZQ4_LEPPY|nr:hypothetical protein ABB37_05687 [Leptomonas pyrrhocoris]XP_015657636.1 hypothetical protein ABB37_05687 [Leptomonas pyrrhocoris]KPA79196.1 hypothetical protein ABB37_05687 [Leptomonas pyrrhocoris]KPA79197.1 hypothetical protein ABB37_05687 [Leptomonas pyrrhocoris]|eukprot:XP_015657635.1 hypothetical protein ABB37_05687 [Leptomonas pyrrhocoris]